MNNKLIKFKNTAINNLQTDITQIKDFHNIITTEIQPTYNLFLELNNLLILEIEKCTNIENNLRHKVKKQLKDNLILTKLLSKLDEY
jgi:high-affinity nickel permease